MNLSGQSVGEISRFYKVNSENIIVFHDELDLAPGKCRFKSGGGHAGHNGLKSIHSHIGENYKRVRLGIGHPGQKDLVSKYVLQDFSKKEQEWLEMLLKRIATEAIHLASESSEKFINQISLGSKNGDNKDKQTNKTKVAPISEKTEVFSDGIEEQKSTLQKLMEKFSRK
jgi:PTH1 family peptidyl-tRNA hydrolase